MESYFGLIVTCFAGMLILGLLTKWAQDENTRRKWVVVGAVVALVLMLWSAAVTFSDSRGRLIVMLEKGIVYEKMWEWRDAGGEGGSVVLNLKKEGSETPFVHVVFCGVLKYGMCPTPFPERFAINEDSEIIDLGGGIIGPEGRGENKKEWQEQIKKKGVWI